MIWYRSTAVAGAVFVNNLGKTERLTVEAFLFTFGKGAKDAARAGALVQIAEGLAEAAIEEAGLRGIRVWVVGETLFDPVDTAESIGLGAYTVGVRIKDKTIAKVGITRLEVGISEVDRGLGQLKQLVFDRVLSAVERVKNIVGGLLR